MVRITKVLGIGKKFPNNPIFFFEGVPNHRNHHNHQWWFITIIIIIMIRLPNLNSRHPHCKPSEFLSPARAAGAWSVHLIIIIIIIIIILISMIIIIIIVHLIIIIIIFILIILIIIIKITTMMILQSCKMSRIWRIYLWQNICRLG